jgi:hypothetical protein
LVPSYLFCLLLVSFFLLVKIVTHLLHLLFQLI